MGPLVLFAAWISGTAALVAEVLWVRGLGRGVGTSAEALSVVSAAFLGGLGVGAAVASRLAPRSRDPLRAAALCEGVAGALVFLSPWAVRLVPSAHLAVLRGLGLDPGPSSWPAALVAIPVLVLPTSFLGATLPFLVRGLVGRLDRAGRWTGVLYGVNTLGAACGVALATFVLLPGAGESASLRLAGAGNLVASLLLATAASIARAARAPQAPAEPSPTGRRWAGAPVALLVSGTLALGAEVAWFRFLEPVIGVHVFGLAVLLGAVLLGTAAGGALGGRLADRVRRPDLAVAVAVGLGGLWTVASIAVAGALPYLAVRSASDVAAAAREAHAAAAEVTQAASAALFRTKVAVAALAVVPALSAFAAAYPLAVRARARDAAEAAGAVGSVYAWNTLGNVLGSLLAGFVFLPRIGGPATLSSLGGAGLATAAALWLAAPRPRSAAAALLFVLPLGALAAPGALARVEGLGPTLPEVVGMGRWSDGYRVRSREDMRVLCAILGGTYPTPPGDPGAPPILPREGVVSTVGLLLERGAVRVRQGGLSESKISPSDPDAGSVTEVALGLAPYLAHPSPKTALVIGHGAGWTVETLLTASLERVDVAEIEPAVLAEVEAYRGPLLVRRAPQARLWTTDGRLLLRAAAQEGGLYDLVVSQPSHPWVPGAGHLFTLEAYRLARAALRPGGVFAQWVNVFGMTADLFRTALASWHAVFPEGWLFLYNDEVVLVGFTAPPHIDVARWERAFAREAVGDRARAAGIAGPADLVRHLALDGEGLGRMLAGGARPSTDDEPRLETGLAWLQFTGLDPARSDRKTIYEELGAAFPPRFADLVPAAAERDALVADVVERLLQAGSRDEARRWLDQVPFDAGARGKRVRARERLAEASAAEETDPKRTALRREAVGLLEEAVTLAPGDAAAAEELLDALVAAGDAREAARRGGAFAEAHPDDGALLAAWGRALAEAEDEAGAAEAYGRALAARGRRAPAGTGLRRARILLAQSAEQASKARDALRADPSTFDDEEAIGLLDRLERELSAPADPKDVPAVQEVERRRRDLERRTGLAKLDAARHDPDGDRRAGLEAARKATELLPDLASAWRIRGWFELRAGDAEAAVVSLRHAIERAADPEEERATARAYLRIFDRDERLLDSAPPPAR